jgi:hypothetical protein
VVLSVALPIGRIYTTRRAGVKLYGFKRNLTTSAQARVSHVKLLIFTRFTLIMHMGKTLIFPRFD